MSVSHKMFALVFCMATEAMYNITEKELREIEIIEEKQRKNIFIAETGIQVTLHIMYLDGGLVPARF